MKQSTVAHPREIAALSIDGLLAMSRLLRESIRYGKHSCLKEVCTDTDRDIFKYPVRIDAFVFVVCSEGLVELSYDLYRVKLPANSMFLYRPGTIVQINALEASRLDIMIFTREFIDDLGIRIDNIPLQYKIVRERQFYPISSAECSQMCEMMHMTRQFIELNKANSYHNELIRSAFKAVIYRALYIMNEQFGMADTGLIPCRENNHFDRFIRLLEQNYKREHSIKFYADMMSLTPKYLSLLIKKVSGKLATEWIDDYVILEAQNLIKYSSMSIQEIAYALNFPNQSFFGKFFKRHTGISPKSYRLQP